MAPSSFGLPPESKVQYVWEELFLVVEYCQIPLSEAYKMPVQMRKWWLGRKKREEEMKAEARKKAAGKRDVQLPDPAVPHPLPR